VICFRKKLGTCPRKYIPATSGERNIAVTFGGITFRPGEYLYADTDGVILEIARAAGISLGLGTDLLGETHDQQSRELLIRGEIEPPADVLRSATVTNARILGREGELGEIVPGALADLLVVDGDPLADLGALQDQGKNLLLVMKGGEALVDRID